MLSKNSFPKIKQVARNIYDVATAQPGSLSMFRSMMQPKCGMPNTSAAENVKRYRGWVYDAVTKNSAERASVPLRLYATRSSGQNKAGMRDGIGKSIGRTITKAERMVLAKSSIGQSARFRNAVDIEEISEHPFLDSFGDSFYDCMMVAMFEELTGNSYTAFELDTLGNPVNPVVLLSQYVKHVIRKGEGIVAYEFGQGVSKIVIPAEQVIHNKFPNPHNPFSGMAPLSAAALAADRDTSMDIYEGALNKIHGRPDFMLTYKDVSMKDLKAYKKEFNAEFKGSGNGGKPMFSGGEATLHNFGFSPREMAFLQGRKITMEQIFGAFGIPVALGKTEGVNRANLEAAILQWTRFTILPRLRMYEDVLNKQLIPLYDEPRLFVAYDNPVPEDREFILKERTANLNNFVTTINEERNADGLEPVEWGDVPVVRSTGLPLGSQPIATTPAKSIDGDSANCSSGGVILKASGAGGDPDDAPDISGGSNTPLNASEKTVSSVTNKMQGTQETDLLKEFDRVSPTESWDDIKFNSTKYTQMYLGEMVGVMNPVWERGLIVGNLSLPDGSRIDVGAFIEQPQAQKFIEKNTFKFLESESESVQNEFRRQLSAGIKDGDSIQAMRKRMTGMFTDERKNARSAMIARSESARAIEMGREASWAESGVVVGKVWDANGDACPFCQAMHGKTVELGGNYWNLGDTMTVDFQGKDIHMSFNYGATPTPPLHPNCRCSLQPQIMDA